MLPPLSCASSRLLALGLLCVSVVLSPSVYAAHHATKTATLSDSPAESDDLATEPPRTISETIAFALGHPAIAARAAQVDAGQAGVGVAKAANLPSLSLDAQGGTQRYDAGFGIRGTAPIGLGRVNLSQSVFDGGTRAADLDAADARLNGAEGELVWQQRQQVFAAAQAHIVLWLAQQLVSADQQSLSALSQIDTATRQRRAVGDATVTEVAEAASRVAAAKARLTAQKTGLAAARQNYLSAVGVPVQTVAAPTLPQIPPMLAYDSTTSSQTQPNLQAFSPATQQILADRVLHHPLIAAAAARTAEAGAGVEHANAQEFPTLDLAANAQHDQFGGLQHNDANNTGSALLNLHYNLYQGGGIKAGERQAKALKKAAEADRDSIALQVSAETNAATARWLGAGQELAQQAVALSESRAVLGSLAAEMRQGNRTLRDLLDARRDEIDVLSAWLGAAAQQAQTAYDLQRWLGDDTTALAPGLLAAQPLRPDLSPEALSIVPGVAWSPVAPKIAVAEISASTPAKTDQLPPLPLPLPLAEDGLARRTTSPTALSSARPPASTPITGAALSATSTPLPVSATSPAAKTIAVKEEQKEPLPDLSAIIPASGPAGSPAASAPQVTTGTAMGTDSVVPSMLKNLPAGAWLVYMPPTLPTTARSVDPVVKSKK